MANGVTQYIGARYVPKFFENGSGTSAWTPNTAYEPLTIVTRNGNSYTSKKPVPANIGAPENYPEYWVSTGIYNDQVQYLIEEIQRIDDELSADIEGVSDRVATLETVRAKLTTKGYLNVVCVGDSWLVGHQTGDIYVTGWAEALSRKLPHGTWEQTGERQAGFATNGASGHNFTKLVENLTADSEVDLVVVVGGLNDSYSNSESLPAAIYTFVDACRAKFPNALVAVYCAQRFRLNRPSLYTWYPRITHLAHYPNLVTIDMTAYIDTDMFYNNEHLTEFGYAYVARGIQQHIVFGVDPTGNHGLKTLNYTVDSDKKLTLNYLKHNGTVRVFASETMDFLNLSLTTATLGQPFTFASADASPIMYAGFNSQLPIPGIYAVSNGDMYRFEGCLSGNSTGGLVFHGSFRSVANGSALAAGSPVSRLTIFPFNISVEGNLF